MLRRRMAPAFSFLVLYDPFIVLHGTDPVLAARLCSFLLNRNSIADLTYARSCSF